MLEIIKKDLFECECDGIAHQVNCRGAWGAGIAKEIRQRWPRSFLVDNMTLKNNPKKLGTFNYSAPNEDQKKYIFNLAGQFNYGRSGQYTDYDALFKSLESLKDFILKMNFDKVFVLGIPFGMGAGLGGGSWEKILSIINYHFLNEDKIKILICKKD